MKSKLKINSLLDHIKNLLSCYKKEPENEFITVAVIMILIHILSKLNFHVNKWSNLLVSIIIK